MSAYHRLSLQTLINNFTVHFSTSCSTVMNKDETFADSMTCSQPDLTHTHMRLLPATWACNNPNSWRHEQAQSIQQT